MRLNAKITGKEVAAHNEALVAETSAQLLLVNVSQSGWESAERLSDLLWSAGIHHAPGVEWTGRESCEPRKWDPHTLAWRNHRRKRLHRNDAVGRASPRGIQRPGRGGVGSVVDISWYRIK